DVVSDEAITNPDLAFSSNLKLTVSGSRSSSTGNFDFVGTRGYYWSNTTSSTGGKYYYFSTAINNTGAGNTRGGGAAVRCLNTTGTVSIGDSVKVSTQNNVAATITTNAGTLQMAATVYPATASQNVTWSIVAGTGTASISATGLVTAGGNGTVWAKAVSVANPAKADSLLVTISNQVVPVSSIQVTTISNAPATITGNAGTLQVQATLFPATTSQNVTWSIVPGTGAASISTSGLVTAAVNGTVWAKAVSVQDAAKTDSLLITITNQVVNVSSIDVVTANNAPATITTNGGTLQAEAIILPANATNQDVTWSIVPGTGAASISNAGLVTASANGTVWAKAVSVQDITIYDSLLITISNQVTPPVAIDSIVVTTLNNANPEITTLGGNLQMVATVYPATASQAVTWSITPATGIATLSASGLITAAQNGALWVKAASVQDPAQTDSMRVAITNQSTGVQELGTLQSVTLYPNPAGHMAYLILKGKHAKLEARLTDVYGRTISHKQVAASFSGSTISFDLSNTAAGLYFITVKGNGIHLVNRLIRK
ncbi:MAG: T9SS type A sorting domain-containing protein, partial [Sphingobacteriales bacterium]